MIVWLSKFDCESAKTARSYFKDVDIAVVATLHASWRFHDCMIVGTARDWHFYIPGDVIMCWKVFLYSYHNSEQDYGCEHKLLL